MVSIRLSVSIRTFVYRQPATRARALILLLGLVPMNRPAATGLSWLNSILGIWTADKTIGVIRARTGEPSLGHFGT